MRRELQDVLHERDVAVAKSARVDDLEETVSELRRHNKEIEDQARRGCGLESTDLFALRHDISTICVCFTVRYGQFGKVLTASDSSDFAAGA